MKCRRVGTNLNGNSPLELEQVTKASGLEDERRGAYRFLS